MFEFISKWNQNRLEKRKTAEKARKEYTEKVQGETAALISDKTAKLKTDLLKEHERLAGLVADVSISAAVTDDCNKLLDDANALIGAKTPDTGAILARFDKIKQRLVRANDSRELKRRWFIRLYLIMVSFFLALALVIGFYKLIPGQSRLESSAWVCLACALWGGIGSTVDAFSAMYKHFGNQDFDKHFLPWYFTHPFMGMAIGSVVYLIFQAGLLSVSGLGLHDTAANVTAASLNITSPPSVDNSTQLGFTALPIALAFLGGFRQSTVMDFLTRLVNAFFPQTGNNASA